MEKGPGFIQKAGAIVAPTREFGGLTHKEWLEKIEPAKAIIILGSVSEDPKDQNKVKLTPDGKNRVLAARELFKWEKAETIITTGGNQIGRKKYENSGAEAERAFLNKLGVKNENIIKEPNASSTNTLENFENIMEILKDMKSVIIVTNGYHVLRAEAQFRNFLREKCLNIEVQCISAEKVLMATKIKGRVEPYDITKKAIRYPKELGRKVLKEGLALLATNTVDKKGKITQGRAEKRKREGKAFLD